MSDLHVTDVEKRYRSTVALRSVSLDVAQGKFVVLLGESGCGKSTLLRIIAGLLRADGGRIQLGDRAIDRLPAHKRDIGLVFQNYALFPHMSVAQNVRFGLDMRRTSRAEAERKVASALELVKLGDYGARMPSQLSGGQQQRVALARALVIGPRLLLLDEPLSNLDAVLRASVRLDIRELHEETGHTTIMVTHDQAEAMTLADSIAVMKDGGILQHGTPQQIYDDAADVFVASFVGSPPAAIVTATMNGERSAVIGGVAWSPGEAAAAAMAGVGAKAFKIGFRPERLSLTEPDAHGAIRGEVRQIEFLGAERMIHVNVGTERLTIRQPADRPLSDGTVGVRVDGTPPIFDAETGMRLRVS
ncbi:MAG: ABC transporter ATP-binding protein [Pseudomonadota bacterium]